MSPRRPIYFLLEPLALLVALTAAVPLLLYSASKRALVRPEGRPFEKGPRDHLGGYWPLPLAGVGALAIVLTVIAAPGLSAVVLPAALLVALSLAAVKAIRTSGPSR